MNVTPESTTCRSNAIPPSWSGYSPQTWSPVNCMAPYPIRPTARSPPIVIVPVPRDMLMDIKLLIRRARGSPQARHDGLRLLSGFATARQVFAFGRADAPANPLVRLRDYPGVGHRLVSCG